MVALKAFLMCAPSVWALRSEGPWDLANTMRTMLIKKSKLIWNVKPRFVGWAIKEQAGSPKQSFLPAFRKARFFIQGIGIGGPIPKSHQSWTVSVTAKQECNTQTLIFYSGFMYFVPIWISRHPYLTLGGFDQLPFLNDWAVMFDKSREQNRTWGSWVRGTYATTVLSWPVMNTFLKIAQAWSEPMIVLFLFIAQTQIHPKQSFDEAIKR